jgi:glycine hydroxymethyltransferase
MNLLQQFDPELWEAMAGEARRQRETLELIASENYTSPVVLAAMGSILTNKYAEGYPGRRYYGGCEWVDRVERLAIDRAKALFGAEHANVQPHSGTQANLAVYAACLKPGDTMLAMDLAHGGHLSHGAPVNMSGKLYRVVRYGVSPKTERIDYDQVAHLAREHRPKLIVAGHSSYPRHLDFARFAEIAREARALLLVDMAHFAGLVAGKVHPDPVPYADFVSSTTHKTLRGPRSGFVLCRKDLAPELAEVFELSQQPDRLSNWLARQLDAAVFPGCQGGPLVHVIAAKAVCFREAMQPEFQRYAEQIVTNARTLADGLARGGLRLVTGGTDNHLLCVDVTSLGLTGKIAERALERAGITVNKNVIPFDTRKPADPSGIRIGTPAVTTRGMKEPEMRLIAQWICQVLRAPEDRHLAEQIRSAVQELCAQFPVPTDREILYTAEHQEQVL